MAPRNHPLARQSKIPLESLNDRLFVMHERGSQIATIIQQLFAKHKIRVRVKLELGSNKAIKEAIAGGLGISVLSQHTLISEKLTGKLTILDVEQFPLQQCWYVAHLCGKQLSVIARAFLNYLLVESKQLEAACLSKLAKV